MDQRVKSATTLPVCETVRLRSIAWGISAKSTTLPILDVSVPLATALASRSRSSGSGLFMNHRLRRFAGVRDQDVR